MIIARNLSKRFGTPPTTALSDVSLKIENGDFLALTGRSGSGKSTLLYTISTLDQPTEGEVEIEGKKVSLMSSGEVHRFRNEKMGFVFQFHYLLAELTVLENILMPARKKKRRDQRLPQAHLLLKEFDIENKRDRFPWQLSGGEQQRVAIARALIMDPAYLFADEPTGNLDSVNGEAVMSIFRRINRENKTTIIMVTHEPAFAAIAKRQLYLADGKIVN